MSLRNITFVVRCSCQDGYALASNGRSCGDIDECLLATDNCDDLATCSNVVGGFTCACKEGNSPIVFFADQTSADCHYGFLRHTV